MGPRGAIGCFFILEIIHIINESRQRNPLRKKEMKPPATSAAPDGNRDAKPGADTDTLAEVTVLHVITGESWGGAPRIVELLSSRMPPTAAVACAPNPRFRRRLEAENVRVIEQPHLQAPPAPTTDLRALFDMIALLRRESFDLVHCHSTKSGILGRVAAAVAGVPTVFSVHGWGFYNSEYDYLSPVLTRVERALESRTDRIVCVSRNDLEAGRRHGILDGTDARVVRNGVPPPELPADRSRLADTGVDTGRPVVGTVARLVEQKRPLDLFRAGRDLQDRGQDPATVWIGTGHLEERCERVVDQLGVNGHLLGFRTDALELTVDFDVFVLTSRFEGFPVSIIEAMHLGLPVVAYDVGGVEEAVVDGETGFVVPAGDREALVDRIEQLLRNPDLRAEFGRRGLERAVETFSVEGMIESYEETYREVLGTVDG